MSEAVWAAMFDELSVAVLILSVGGRVIAANLAARALLEAGWPVRLLDGSLQGKDRAATDNLKQAIDAAVHSPDPQDHELCLAQSGEGQKGAIGYIRSLRCIPGAEPLIALFITETGQKSLYCLDALAEAYGLSKAETRALKAFVEAQNLAETAAQLNVAVSTVKSHIKKIFHKTNTSRQLELVRLVECCRTPFRKAGNEKS